MAVTLNIGLDNTPYMSQRSAINLALRIIGPPLVREWKLVDVAHENAVDKEDTLVVDLYTDITPSTVYAVAEALRQDCVAYLNDSGEQDIGLLIGPRPYPQFKHEFFRLIDGRAPDGPAPDTD